MVILPSLRGWPSTTIGDLPTPDQGTRRHSVPCNRFSPSPCRRKWTGPAGPGRGGTIHPRLQLRGCSPSVTIGEKLTLTGWWLSHPSEKNILVSWDDDIPNSNGKIKFMFQTTNQLRKLRNATQVHRSPSQQALRKTSAEWDQNRSVPPANPPSSRPRERHPSASAKAKPGDVATCNRCLGFPWILGFGSILGYQMTHRNGYI